MLGQFGFRAVSLISQNISDDLVETGSFKTITSPLLEPGSSTTSNFLSESDRYHGLIPDLDLIEHNRYRTPYSNARLQRYSMLDKLSVTKDIHF